MTAATSPLEANRRTIVACIGVTQVIAFGVAASSFAHHWGVPDPWLTVVEFGTVLAQCSLAAAFAVFGPWSLFPRAAASATVVVAGGLVMVMAESSVRRSEDAILISLFSLLMWGTIQTPLWLCRLLLRARTVSDLSAATAVNRAQYGIRQLMSLTFTVALILGLGRVLVPPQVVEELKNIGADGWILLGSVAVAAGLIVSTTIMTTLNPHYWRVGLIVSAALAGLVAFGIYSICAMIGFTPVRERPLFAALILCTYGWLQLSLLALRVAGYRIVVGG